MSGLYLHIPYCRHKCNYCNFFSLASGKYRDEIADLLVTEMQLQKDYLGGEELNTLYFGGGTPSLLGEAEIGTLMDSIHSTFSVSEDAEITLEANPDDLTPGQLRMLKDSGINRLSIGIQSFRDEDLQYLDRIHTARQAEYCIRLAQDSGFENFSIDLIFGIPTLDEAAWESNLEKATASGAPHLSAYALTVEERTALQRLIHSGKRTDVRDEEQAKQFSRSAEVLTRAGFLHYEISNYAKPGWLARHNTSYWRGEHYLGIGPSAHSYEGVSRQWNVASLGAYREAIREKRVPFEKEVLTRTQHFNEYVMTSLRTMWGIDLQMVSDRFGEEWSSDLVSGAGAFIGRGQLMLTGRAITLTGEGKLFADGIAATLFREE